MSARDIVVELRDHQNGGRRAGCEAAAAEIERLRSFVKNLAALREGLWNGNSAAEQAASDLAAQAAALVEQINGGRS